MIKISSGLVRLRIYEWSLPHKHFTSLLSGIGKVFPSFESSCNVCNAKTTHEKQEMILCLPDVLVVNLQRYKQTQSNRITSKDCKHIYPSIVLQIGETSYYLNAVVTHDGQTTSQGCMITLWNFILLMWKHYSNPGCP